MPKLRTVIWDFIGEPFSEEEVTALRRLELALQPNAELSQSLGELLREDENSRNAPEASGLTQARCVSRA